MKASEIVLQELYAACEASQRSATALFKVAQRCEADGPDTLASALVTLHGTAVGLNRAIFDLFESERSDTKFQPEAAP